MSKKKFKFYVFNIKLQSSKTGEDRIKAYEELILNLTKKKRFTRLTKSDAITLYPPYERDEKGIKYFYGNIGKGISFFDKEVVNVLNNNNVSKEAINQENIFEPIMGQYIFVPSIHRFALLKTANSISIFEMEKFLREHLVKLVKPEEVLEIDFEKEPSVINEIFNAYAVYSLSYEISYTNNDALSAQGELFDNILKDNHIGKLNVTAVSDYETEGMNIKDVDFLGGGLEVAKKNGVVKSAVIKPTEKKRRKRVTNKENPSVYEVEMINENDNQSFHWFKKLLNLYQS